VPVTPANFPSPRWEIADVLSPTLACTIVNASVNNRMYVQQRPWKFPMAPMGKLLTCLPDSRLHNCERFGQLQYVRATETLKTSHRPNGSRADMPKSILIFQFGSIFVLPGICTCQPRLQTSHRPDG